jgi:cysteine desulfurase/selenocysteine lyase
LEENANVHRGVHTLAERATSKYEEARVVVRDFIHAKSEREIVFTSGTTESLNLLATSLSETLLEGDEILLSVMEHHANIVPWQQVAKRTGAKLRFVKVSNGMLDMADFQSLLNEKTKIVSLTHISNVLGCVNPVKEIALLTHDVGALLIVDGAQSAPHIPIDVQELDCDFFVFSGHKMLAATGIGVMWGKEERLNELEPAKFGGEMIDFVELYSSTWADLPHKFEAGTPNIEGAISLGEAIRYLNGLGMREVQAHIDGLIEYTMEKLKGIEGVTVYGPKDSKDRSGIIAFNLDGLHPHDVASAFDMQGIAVRAGHHCAQPLIRSLETGVFSTVRASFYIYNTFEDCDQFLEAIIRTKEYFEDGIN